MKTPSLMWIYRADSVTYTQPLVAKELIVSFIDFHFFSFVVSPRS